MSGLTYLVTGANRGIGKGIVSTLVLHPQNTVIAAVRDISSSTKILHALPVGEGSKIIIVKIDAKSATDASHAVSELRSNHKITKIDVLISNAGLLHSIVPVTETTAEALREHLEVNTIGPFVLLKAFLPLLEAAVDPKFVVISGSLGSTQLLEKYQVPFFAYGISKAAVNHFVRKLSLENDRLISVAIHPGWVLTDMGLATAKGIGIEVGVDEAPMEPISLKECVDGIIKQCSSTSKERSGAFLTHDGEVLPW